MVHVSHATPITAEPQPCPGGETFEATAKREQRGPTGKGLLAARADVQVRASPQAGDEPEPVDRYVVEDGGLPPDAPDQGVSPGPERPADLGTCALKRLKRPCASYPRFLATTAASAGSSAMPLRERGGPGRTFGGGWRTAPFRPLHPPRSLPTVPEWGLRGGGFDGRNTGSQSNTGRYIQSQ